MAYRVMEYPSPVGKLTVVSREESVIGLWIEGQKYFAQGLSALPEPGERSGILIRAKDWLDRYFAGEKPSPGELPLAPEGSEFRRRVWRLLEEIPYGRLVSYGELAARLGSSPRAVGGAVGHNPISIIIPCHRVVGSGGGLTGYAGGVDRKRRLLEHEMAAATW